MKTKKSTKRALLGSVAIIALCLVMLVGTTFAWFTDTASTGVNTITSGNLKIQLDYAKSWNRDGTPNEWADTAEMPKGESLAFVQKKDDGTYTANAQMLWEPGGTYQLQQLRITNTGNLALKYKVEISKLDGSEKLNEVVDWTMTVGGKTYTLGEEHHLLPDAVEEITIQGHMQESAGNGYQNESITGAMINVYAVQDAVEYDSFGNIYDVLADGTPDIKGWNWLDNVAVTGTVNTAGATVLKDREQNPTVVATVPEGSTSATTLTLTKTAGETPANIEVVTGTKAFSANISLTDQDGKAVSAQSGKFFVLTMQQTAGANVIAFYHNSEPMTKVTSAEAVSAQNDAWYYDAATGVLTFSTDDFSPFTVVTSDSIFNGGKGTAESPYLVATGEQAYQVRNYKGYFKQVADVVVTNELYLFGKTVAWDLNGHSIKLEYSDGITPNNGGVFNISGKKSSLTINDSSEGQTGAVIGSDKTYSNKVTSAVRVGNYGNLTINGGHFYGMSQGTSCIFVMTSRSSGSKAAVTINGGKFEVATPNGSTYYVLNHQDSATTACTITVNGGSFKNYNPGVTVVDPVNAYTGKIALGTDCTTTSEAVGSDTWYTVK